MLESCQNAQERWGGVHKLIDGWLKARHELVRAFDALGAKPEALSENRKPLQEFLYAAGIRDRIAQGGRLSPNEKRCAMRTVFLCRGESGLSRQLFLVSVVQHESASRTGSGL